MSVVLSSITNQTTEAEVELAGISVQFTYKPYVITLGMSMELAEGGVEMISILADVIESWNLVIEEGKPFPVTEENLRSIPTELATLMAREITGGDAVGEADSSSAGT